MSARASRRLAVTVALTASAGLVVLPARVVSAVTEPRVVAAYAFDEGSGAVAADSSGNGLNGQIIGAQWTTDGAYGDALSFDGTDSRVVIGGDDRLNLTNGFTLDAWVKPEAVDGWRTIALRERGAGLSYGLYAGSDRGGPAGVINTGDGDHEAAVVDPLAVGAWSHVATTYDPAVGLVVYVNGVQVAAQDSTVDVNADGAGALTIGGNAVWGEWFSGIIDEVRVWDGPLDAFQVQYLPNRSVAPPAGDRFRPRVLYPWPGQRIGGIALLTADWGSGEGLTGTQYLLDGQVLTEPAPLPFGGPRFEWDTTTSTSGWHRIGIRSFYDDGTSVDSAPVSVQVVAKRDDLRAAYGFNDRGALTAYDYSGHHNDAGLNDVTTVPGEYGFALTRGGELGSAWAPDSPTLWPGDALTVSAWVHPRWQLDTTQPVVVKQAWAGPVEYGLYASYKGGGLTGVVTTDTGTFTVVGDNLPIDQDRHVALTYDGNTLRLFIDYNEVASAEAHGTVIDGDGELRMISSPGDGTYDEYQGYLDSVRIYDHALSGQELGSDTSPN
jgi:Concanavalin A-like lectin/glucanases superfamily